MQAELTVGRHPKLGDEELLDRAMDTFWRRGWAATSIRDLEVAVGVKAPSIYRRFENKEALGAAVIDHYVDRVIRRRVAKLLPGTGDPMANVERFFERSVTEAGDGSGLRGCLVTTMSVEAGGGPAIGRAIDRGLQVIEAALRREVDRAAELGVLAPGIAPDAAAATLSLAMQGLMAMARAGASPAELRRRARAAVSVVSAPSPG